MELRLDCDHRGKEDLGSFQRQVSSIMGEEL